MKLDRRIPLTVISVAVALIAMGLWIRTFDVSAEAVADLFHSLHWGAVLPLAALLAGHVALSAWRWQMIEEGLGGARPQLSSAYATGAFALGLGTFLPSPVVNILCRALANRYAGTSALRGALSGSLDQMADFAIALLFAIPAAIALYYRDLSFYVWGAGAVALLGLAAITLASAAAKRGEAYLRRTWLSRISPLLERDLLMRLYGISLLRIVNLTLMTLMVQMATGAASAAAVIVAVPIVTVAISLAMLPGSIGSSEWSFSAVFSAFSIAKPGVVAFVLGNRILLMGLSLTLALTTLVVTALAIRHRRG